MPFLLDGEGEGEEEVAVAVAEVEVDGVMEATEVGRAADG
jgi:hypothetical protein